MPGRIGIIDIGTNTINLLVVNKHVNSYTILHKERQVAGLGNGGLNNSIITPESFNKGVNCLDNYVKICTAHNVKLIYAYGTSMLRQAKNAEKFIKSVKKQTNIDIQILNGDEEANLIYNGVKLGYNFHKKSVVMDIGGGSTEFILADKNGLIDKVSLDIGVSRINQLFNFNSTLSKDDVNSIELFLQHKIGNQLNAYKASQLIGASGSFKTFFELVNKKKYDSTLFQKINTASINKTLNTIIRSSYQERLENPYILNLRSELLAISAVKTKWILKRLKCKHVIVSPNSIKEGAIFNTIL